MQNYRIGKTIGVGAFGKVKLAVHELTGQRVAVKILNRKKLKKMEMGEKVRTEIQILRLFHHPHIIRLYEVIDTPTDIYSVMEYVSGGELFDYIVSRGRLEEREARYMFQQIISGVEYCHHHMVVHRDLKPENLLLDADHRVKLADFGLSNVMRDGQFLKTSCGSPNYAAPEVISGNLYAGPEVDVWSCGVILYAILCGSLPFDDENIRNLFRKIKGGLYTIPSYVSDQARDLLQRMLVVDPIKRCTMAEIRNHKWFQTNLPAYLALSAEKQIERTQTIDDGILQDVMRFGFPRDQIVAALSVGSELLTSRKMAQHVDARQMAVSYHLLLDQKNRLEHNITNVVAPVLTNEEKNEGKEGKNLYADGRIDHVDPLKDSASASKADAPHTHTSSIMSSSISTSSQTSTGSLSPTTSLTSLSISLGNWALGRWSKDDPQRIMNELYRTLKSLNFEWKVMSVFKIKARHPAGLVDRDGQSVDSMDVVKIQMQLYKVPPASPSPTSGGAAASSSSSASSSSAAAPASAVLPPGAPTPSTSPVYVLDMTKLYGQMFLHLDFCAKILSQLRLSPVSSQVLMSGAGLASLPSVSTAI